MMGFGFLGVGRSSPLVGWVGICIFLGYGERGVAVTLLWRIRDLTERVLVLIEFRVFIFACNFL